jgi:hypothetical protein
MILSRKISSGQVRSGQVRPGKARALNHSLASSRQLTEERSRDHKRIKVPLWLRKPESSCGPGAIRFIIGFYQIAACGVGDRLSSAYSIDLLA